MIPVDENGPFFREDCPYDDEAPEEDREAPKEKRRSDKLCLDDDESEEVPSGEQIE